MRHYNKTLRKDKFGVLEGKLREDKPKELKCYLHWQQNVHTVATKTNETAVQASFIVSHIIVKKPEPFTDYTHSERVYSYYENSGNAVSRETVAFYKHLSANTGSNV